MNKILGYEKYRIVNEDIKEGLQNIIVGSEKYSNTAVKAEIFLERLKESRQGFLNDFLQPEIKQVCKNMGFRNYPTARFKEVDTKDSTQTQRVATRLMELGLITPEQGMDVIGIDNDMRARFFGKEASTAWNRERLKKEIKSYTHKKQHTPCKKWKKI